VSWVEHLEAKIVSTWRNTWRPRSCDIRDARGGPDSVYSEIHLEVIIECVGSYT
jgi:hypothetical protein